MAGNPAGYGYGSGYGSDPAIGGMSAGYPGSSAYDHDSVPDAQYGFGSKDLNALQNTTSEKEQTQLALRRSTIVPYLHCLHKGCDFVAKCQFDLDRHEQIHFPPPSIDKLDCPGRGCGRHGDSGFARSDHLREHLRKVHARDVKARYINTRSREGAKSEPTIRKCLHPGCEYQSKCQYTYDGHQKTNSQDHLREHLRGVHAEDPSKDLIREERPTA